MEKLYTQEELDKMVHESLVENAKGLVQELKTAKEKQIQSSYV